jgi:putative Holliday junction resolvase
VVALDVGTVRIGVAASDPTGCFAQGVTVLRAAGDWMEELSAILDEYNSCTILIGMPRRTNGADGPEAKKMKHVAKLLEARFPHIEVIPWDERFTTTIATQTLLEADVSRRGRKCQVDKVAATVLLQSYLDSMNRGVTASPPPLPVMDQASSRKGGRRGGKRAYE